MVSSCLLFVWGIVDKCRDYCRGFGYFDSSEWVEVSLRAEMRLWGFATCGVRGVDFRDTEYNDLKILRINLKAQENT
jgi:hypothetical protein